MDVKRAKVLSAQCWSVHDHHVFFFWNAVNCSVRQNSFNEINDLKILLWHSNCPLDWLKGWSFQPIISLFSAIMPFYILLNSFMEFFYSSWEDVEQTAVFRILSGAFWALLREPANTEAVVRWCRADCPWVQTWQNLLERIKLKSACSTDSSCSSAFLMTSSCLCRNSSTVALHTLFIADL